jgi:hypothetical protein
MLENLGVHVSALHCGDAERGAARAVKKQPSDTRYDHGPFHTTAPTQHGLVSSRVIISSVMFNFIVHLLLIHINHTRRVCVFVGNNPQRQRLPIGLLALLLPLLLIPDDTVTVKRQVPGELPLALA